MVRIPTKIWEEKFFEVFGRTGNLSRSAREAGVTREAVYKRKERHAEFRRRLDDATEEALDEIESVLETEAKLGDVRTGQWILARRRPNKWGDPVQRTQIEATTTGPHEIVLKFDDGTPVPPLPRNRKKE